jgi:hypothetical protein
MADNRVKITVTANRPKPKPAPPGDDTRYGPFARDDDEDLYEKPTAYLIHGESLLAPVRVYDIGKRTDPRLKATIENPYPPVIGQPFLWAPSVARAGVGYMVDGGGGSTDTIYSINLSSPKSPKLLDTYSEGGFFPSSGGASLDEATGDTLLVSGFKTAVGGVIKAFNVADPSNISLATTTGVWNKGLPSVKGGYAYTATMGIPAASDPSKLWTFSTTPTITQLHSLQFEPGVPDDTCTTTGSGSGFPTEFGDGMLYVAFTFRQRGTWQAGATTLAECLNCVDAVFLTEECANCEACLSCITVRIEAAACSDCADCIADCAADCGGLCADCVTNIENCMRFGACVDIIPASTQILVFSLANPAAPALVNSIEATPEGNRVIMMTTSEDKKRLYMVVDEPEVGGAQPLILKVYSLHSSEGGAPENPVLIGSLTLTDDLTYVITGGFYATNDKHIYLGMRDLFTGLHEWRIYTSASGVPVERKVMQMIGNRPDPLLCFKGRGQNL